MTAALLTAVRRLLRAYYAGEVKRGHAERADEIRRTLAEVKKEQDKEDKVKYDGIKN